MRLDFTSGFHMNIHCTLQSFTSQSFRNPFDISRDGLLGQLARMRTNFLRASPTTPNLIEEGRYWGGVGEGGGGVGGGGWGWGGGWGRGGMCV